jgi:hypothetical protein
VGVTILGVKRLWEGDQREDRVHDYWELRKLLFIAYSASNNRKGLENFWQKVGERFILDLKQKKFEKVEAGVKLPVS